MATHGEGIRVSEENVLDFEPGDEPADDTYYLPRKTPEKPASSEDSPHKLASGSLRARPAEDQHSHFETEDNYSLEEEARKGHAEQPLLAEQHAEPLAAEAGAVRSADSGS